MSVKISGTPDPYWHLKVLPPSNLESWYRDNAPSIAGIDEAGRGPLAGPVVAAAVVFEKQHAVVGLADSKKLTEKRRELLFDQIIQNAKAYGIGIVAAPQIDEMNILRASLLAMKLSIDDLHSKVSWKVSGALVDGNQKAPLTDIIQWTIVGGDAIWPVIMAASILAKVTRDRLMLGFDKQYPQYGFAQHKGYGTAIHLEALRRFGPTPIHRRSFAPVRESETLGLWTNGAS